MKKINWTRVLLIAVAALFLVSLLALAFAAVPVHAMSCDGSIHGAFANLNGPFGWLGLFGGAAGYHGVVGQEVGATGYNNSQAAAACNK